MPNALYLGNSGMLGGAQPTAPIKSVNEPAVGGPQIPTNQVGPQAIRASGPAQGYDPGYLQNLATYIGSLFSRPSGAGNVTSFNPLGNLNEVSPPGEQIGNAPNFGAPMTWLQQALNGGGFSLTPPTPPSAPTSMGFGGRTNRHEPNLRFAS